MRIAVYGTGGVGGYFGGRLAQAGEDVIFIARGRQLESIRGQGLRVDSIKGDFVIKPIQATDDPGQVGVADVILVGVKAWQVPEAARAMRPMVAPATLIVPLQNGVEATPQLAAVLGTEHVLIGLCGLMVFITGPGHIRHVALDPFISFGEPDNRSTQRVENLRQVFGRTVGVRVDIHPDMHTALWMKFLFLTASTGVGAVTRSPMGIYRSLDGCRKMFEQAAQEVCSVALARKIVLPPNSVSQMMAMLNASPAKGTTSIQRDIMQGRPSELEALNGAVVRMGRELGVETPVNAFLYYSLLPTEMRARGQIEFT